MNTISLNNTTRHSELVSESPAKSEGIAGQARNDVSQSRHSELDSESPCLQRIAGQARNDGVYLF